MNGMDDSPDFRNSITLIIVGLGLGMLSGLVLNVIWIVFQAWVLGWGGESSGGPSGVLSRIPGALYLGSLTGWIIGSQIHYARSKNKSQG